MAKKSVASKRVPKPAKPSRGPSRPPAKGHANRNLAKKPAAASNGQSAITTAAPEPRKAGPMTESALRALDRQILQLISRRAEATTKMIEAAPDRNAALYDLRGDDLLWQELAAANPGPMPMAAIRGVFNACSKASMNVWPNVRTSSSVNSIARSFNTVCNPARCRCTSACSSP